MIKDVLRPQTARISPAPKYHFLIFISSQPRLSLGMAKRGLPTRLESHGLSSRPLSCVVLGFASWQFGIPSTLFGGATKGNSSESFLRWPPHLRLTLLKGAVLNAVVRMPESTCAEPFFALRVDRNAHAFTFAISSLTMARMAVSKSNGFMVEGWSIFCERQSCLPPSALTKAFLESSHVISFPHPYLQSLDKLIEAPYS